MPYDAGNSYGKPRAPISGGRRFNEMFSGAPTVPDNFGSFGAFLAAVHSGEHDPRLMQATASGMDQEIGAEGGYLLSTEHVVQFLDASLETEVARPRADIQPIMNGAGT